MVVDDTLASSFDGDDPLTIDVDQGDDMGRSFASDFETNIGSTQGGHSFSSDTPFDVASDPIHEEQVVSVGSVADADDMLEIGELNTDSHDLAIVTHVGHSFEHWGGDSDAIDPDAVPLSFSVPQTILTGGVTGMFSFCSYFSELSRLGTYFSHIYIYF